MRNHGGTRELNKRINELAQQLPTDTDWTTRQLADYQIPDHEFAWLKTQAGRFNTLWDNHRTAISALIWATITGQEPALAPHWRQPPNNPDIETQPVSIVVRYLIRRATPAFTAAIETIANKATTPPAP